MTRRLYIGIDPGMHGAIALLWPELPPTIIDTPVAGKEYLGASMVAPLQQAARYGNAFVALELPVVFRGSGGGSSLHTIARQYRGIGLWEGMIVACGLPYALVGPPAWRRAVGLPSKKDAGKDASRALAQRLFPEVANQLQRVKDDGRAEALLIAEWGRRTDARPDPSGLSALDYRPEE